MKLFDTEHVYYVSVWTYYDMIIVRDVCEPPLEHVLTLEGKKDGMISPRAAIHSISMTESLMSFVGFYEADGSVTIG